MPTTLLRARTLDELRSKAIALGPGARLISAEAVRPSGLARLRRLRFEGLAVIPDVDESDFGLVESGRDTLPDLGPIAPGDDVSAMLHELGAPLMVDERAGGGPLRAPGSLTVVAAPHDAALGPAMALAETVGGQLYTSGLLEAYGRPGLEGRRQAAAAREQGAALGKPVVVAFGLGRPAWTASNAAAAERLHADQVWLVVDARHKHADTASWVAAVQTRLVVHALAVTGLGETSTPGTVERLGVPVGWTDQSPVWS
ncbi:hypothetical protein [Sinomonas susongensis]|uniref:hypothetical protein n=1 Tax=Sinomonas susongensis TaxID=1324851 RepID=UPI001109C44E|nr:hypothetical protein [Sinomonas susongensis]